MKTIKTIKRLQPKSLKPDPETESDLQPTLEMQGCSVGVCSRAPRSWWPGPYEVCLGFWELSGFMFDGFVCVGLFWLRGLVVWSFRFARSGFRAPASGSLISGIRYLDVGLGHVSF